jgi:hypothetical protein
MESTRDGRPREAIRQVFIRCVAANPLANSRLVSDKRRSSIDHSLVAHGSIVKR